MGHRYFGRFKKKTKKHFDPIISEIVIFILLEIARGHFEISQRVLYHSLIGLYIRTIDYADVYKDRKKNVYSRASIFGQSINKSNYQFISFITAEKAVNINKGIA